MPAPAAALPPSELSLDPCALGESILRHEAAALAALAHSLGGGSLADDFRRATRMVLACRGSVIVSGMGKAGLVGQKICATLASTGTRSHFLHPGEAVHGDLGRVRADDLVLMLSYSGRTEEVVRLLPLLAEMQVPVLAMTGRRQSPLGQAAAVLLHVDVLGEACPLGLAPSTSTTAMLALGDALALVVSRARGFTADDFARYHPGGSLGLALTSVEQTMRPVTQCRVALVDERLREALISHRKPGRRSGAIMVIDADGRLAGIFTDSDLARLLEQGRDAQLDGPMSQVMTRGPATVPIGTRVSAACDILSQRKISELPVVDAEGRPLGMLDITDVVGEMPSEGSKFQDPGFEWAPNRREFETAPIIPLRLHEPAGGEE
jgi:arabinose-5-phosphate isomerase